MENLLKIIYFDRETIENFLQVYYKGNSTKEKNLKKATSFNNNTNSEIKLKLVVPFWEKIGFIFTNKLSVDYLSSVTRNHTITSTELSEFDNLKDNFKRFGNISLSEIENSSTTFRVAGSYMKVLPEGVEEVNIAEFNEVMNQFDGYDTYKISDHEYVRFNNSAFISNYKKNDVLLSIMTLYCIKVGDFEKEDFDFLSRITNMQKLFKQTNDPVFLADLDKKTTENPHPTVKHTSNKDISLYDVVLAEIGDNNINE